jgi:hypothetical protein
VASRGLRRPPRHQSHESMVGKPSRDYVSYGRRTLCAAPARARRPIRGTITTPRVHPSSDSLLAARRPLGQAEKTGMLESRRMEDSHDKMDQGDTPLQARIPRHMHIHIPR